MFKYLRQKQRQISIWILNFNLINIFREVWKTLKIPLADRRLTAAVIFHQVLDGLCQLHEKKKKHLLYQQIPSAFSSSVIDMWEGHDHEEKQQ